MLKIKNVSKAFSRKGESIQVLENFSMEVEVGSLVAVQGASGCGKTTLLLAAAGLLCPDSGTVEVMDVPLYSLGGEERALFRNKHIGVVFQQFHLMPYLSAKENILLPAMVAGQKADGAVLELMEEFGLESRGDHKPAELSTGERQRTALARALLMKPSILLADEPTANLDRANAEIVLGALSRFARDGHAVLMVSHDPRISGVADRTVQLSRTK